MAAIEKRGENSYRLTVSCGYDKQGKQIRKSKTIDLTHISIKKQETEAQKQWILFKEEIEKGIYLDAGKITFEDFITKWLKEYAEVSLAPKTLARYKEILDSRVIPALGHLKLNKIQPTHLTEFYNNLRESGIRKDGKEGGLSERTILHHHRIISTILTAAVQWQFILNNPAERLKPPKVEKKETKHFDEEQIQYIFELLEQEPIKYKTMIHLAVFGGMRMGELSGLEWQDFDSQKQMLTIRQSSQYIPGKGIFTKSPKNESSKRLISLPKSIVSLLNEYKLWQNGEKATMDDLWVDSKRIFTKNDGTPIFPDTPSRWFTKFIKRHNKNIMKSKDMAEQDKGNFLLPNVSFHGLRHTNATLLISQGVDVTTVSKRLGHARTSTTTDIYAHSLRKSDLEAANKLDSLFNKQAEARKQG
ncbi:MAG: hypothetical protein K0R80_2433 [Clostridia bacterium]|jgi:integrase|nr:hypothetical protein [Clostridia bacterium]